MSTILLVRSRQELTNEFVSQLESHFGSYIDFVEVEPRTPDELLLMVRQYDAVAVVLRENPLPKATIEAGIPCIPIRYNEPLKRLVRVDPVVAYL